ncbi:type II toxin-antitoxin system HicA family toxin [Pseudonocardia sp.]|uniref:type II toxin-antitoxin system HicA family toxin n=1 Tax=Pseudonocardia sp. TaxID=60912 RepID=UPI003D0E6AD5
MITDDHYAVQTTSRPPVGRRRSGPNRPAAGQSLAGEIVGGRGQRARRAVIPHTLEARCPGADGWYLVVVRGSHRQHKHPTKPGRTTVAGKPSATLHPRAERSPEGRPLRAMEARSEPDPG